MHIGTICDTDATTVSAGTDLSQAARLLSSGFADALVVVATPAQRPTAIGILTYREIQKVLMGGDDLKSARVLDVLNPNPLVLHEEEDIDAAILKLRSRGARYAPVIGSGGTLWGLISLDRLLGCRTMGLQFRSAALAESTYK